MSTASDTGRVRVLIVDDHQLFRAGVRSELEAHCDIVGEAKDVNSALAEIAGAEPDVVLLDVHLPGGGGVEVLKQLAAKKISTKVLALSVSDAEEDVVEIVRAGALGYVTKTISTQDLVDAIKQTQAGEPVFGPRLATFVLRAFAAGSAAPEAENQELDALTPREQEVLHLLARGYAYKQIGLRLEISPRTVESHVSAVLRKLQLTSRHEVSRWAAEQGLL